MPASAGVEQRGASQAVAGVHVAAGGQQGSHLMIMKESFTLRLRGYGCNLHCNVTNNTVNGIWASGPCSITLEF